MQLFVFAGEEFGSSARAGFFVTGGAVNPSPPPPPIYPRVWDTQRVTTCLFDLWKLVS